MRNSKWIRVGAAAAAAGALVAMSSSASAQSSGPSCEYIAYVVCSVDERGHPQEPTWECFEREYAYCMSYSQLEAGHLPKYDRRREAQAAA